MKNNDNILRFTSTYDPNNSNDFPKVREMYGNLQTLRYLGKIFPKHRLIDRKRQPSNLKRLLYSSNFSKISQLSKQQNTEKVAFVAIILYRVNSLN